MWGGNSTCVRGSTPIRCQPRGFEVHNSGNRLAAEHLGTADRRRLVDKAPPWPPPRSRGAAGWGPRIGCLAGLTSCRRSRLRRCSWLGLRALRVLISSASALVPLSASAALFTGSSTVWLSGRRVRGDRARRGPGSSRREVALARRRRCPRLHATLTKPRVMFAAPAHRRRRRISSARGACRMRGSSRVTG